MTQPIFTLFCPQYPLNGSASGDPERVWTFWRRGKTLAFSGDQISIQRLSNPYRNILTPLCLSLLRGNSNCQRSKMSAVGSGSSHSCTWLPTHTPVPSRSETFHTAQRMERVAALLCAKLGPSVPAFLLTTNEWVV
jgi:hypothetical protein